MDSFSCFKLVGKDQRWYGLSTSPIEQLTSQFAEAKASTDSNYWTEKDIKAGLVWIDDKNRDQFLPHDLSLPAFGAVNFEKGCYTGQEIVARMEYRGTPKYSLAIVETEETSAEIPDKLLQLIDSNEKNKIGQVVEKTHLDDDRYLIIASLKRAAIEQEKIKLSSSEQAILCTITTPEY